MTFYILKAKAGGNLPLQPYKRGGGYLFRPQLLSLFFFIFIYCKVLQNTSYGLTYTIFHHSKRTV